MRAPNNKHVIGSHVNISVPFKYSGEKLGTFLGAFGKLREANIIHMSRMSVHLSAWNSSTFIGRKSVEKIQVLLTSDKNNGYSI